MSEKAFAMLRRAAEEKYQRALQKIAKFEQDLEDSDAAAAPTVIESRPVQTRTNRGLVEPECKNWASVAGISKATNLSDKQVRGVLYDSHYKERYERRKSENGAPTQFRMKEKYRAGV